MSGGGGGGDKFCIIHLFIKHPHNRVLSDIAFHITQIKMHILCASCISLLFIREYTLVYITKLFAKFTQTHAPTHTHACTYILYTHCTQLACVYTQMYKCRSDFIAVSFGCTKKKKKKKININKRICSKL